MISVWIRLAAIASCLFLFAGNVPAQDKPLTSTTTKKASNKNGKLSHRLGMLAQSPALAQISAAARNETLGLPAKGPGSIIQDAQGRVMVYIHMDDLTDASVKALQDGGAQILNISDRYKAVTAYVSPANLSNISGLTALHSIKEVLTPERRSTCPAGTAVSEGDAQLHAAQARSTYGIDGATVKVGVLSDSYDKNSSAVTNAAADVFTGDLPGSTNTCGYTTPVNVFQEYASAGTDEGRGMLQIVHDLAPGATLSFATAFSGLFEFADNIRSLQTAGADIIVDDVSYFDEPFFQEGPVNVAISDVVNAGALYFTSAGNGNLIIGGNNISSYEAPNYRPISCPAVLTSPTWGESDCHDFEPGGATNSNGGITLSAGCSLRIGFQWNEPWYGVTDDFDIFLLDGGGNIVAFGYDDNLTGQEPFEFLSYTNTTGSTANYSIVLARYSGTGTPRLKYAFLQNGNSCIASVQYNASNGGDTVGPTLDGHSATLDGFSVAAVPYNNANTPESFTSRGPATHYYGPVVGTTPAASITPYILQPDFAATDGGCTTFFGSFSAGCYRFYGTSAAAPHAAAVTSLLKQRANQLSMPLIPMVAGYVLQSTAQAVSSGSLSSVGAGLLNALAALSKLSSLDPILLVSVDRIVNTYTAVQTAYNNSLNGDIIEMLATTFTGDLTFGTDKSVTLRGGYASGYASQTGNTVVHGSLTIGSGSIAIDQVILN